MRNWNELAADFDALTPVARGLRLDHQYGAAGEHWRLVGGLFGEAESRFKTLAHQAGVKLLDVPTTIEWPDVASENDPIVRWYRALRAKSMSYRQADFYGIQLDEQGNEAGIICCAKIDNLCQASATLCIALESLESLPQPRIELLGALPRYEGPSRHWQDSQSLLHADSPDYRGASREAVNALEGMCRIVLGDSSLTLGDSVKRLRQRGLVHPALAKPLEGLWGYASAEPDIRHGAPSRPAVDPTEARFVVDCCEAAIALLLSLDTGMT